MSKKEWKMGQIFVAFSEYLNFIKNFTMRRATILQWVIISVAKEVLTRAYLSTYISKQKLTIFKVTLLQKLIQLLHHL